VFFALTKSSSYSKKEGTFTISSNDFIPYYKQSRRFKPRGGIVSRYLYFRTLSHDGSQGDKGSTGIYRGSLEIPPRYSFYISNLLSPGVILLQYTQLNTVFGILVTATQLLLYLLPYIPAVPYKTIYYILEVDLREYLEYLHVTHYYIRAPFFSGLYNSCEL
jgi:hypothetical protein